MIFNPAKHVMQLYSACDVRNYPPGVVPEHLMHFGVVVIVSAFGDTFVNSGKNQVNTVCYSCIYPSWRHQVIAKVTEPQILAYLGQATIDADGVFIHAGAIGPLPS
jgi:hypothetical protein